MDNKKEKVKIGVFSFTCCEGCALSILECEDELLDLLNVVEIDNFREASSYKGKDYTIAFIEGSCTREEEIPILRSIRRIAKIVVTIGSCSSIGGLNCIKNLHKIDDARREVYGNNYEWFHTIETRPIEKVIKVDYRLHGCPINKNEFLEFVKIVASGRTFKEPDNPVCVECKLRGYTCVFEFGRECLGPITRCGCEAICTSRGDGCMGCRGLVNEPNIEGLKEAFKEYGFNEEDVYYKLELFNSYFLKDIKDKG